MWKRRSPGAIQAHLINDTLGAEGWGAQPALPHQIRAILVRVGRTQTALCRSSIRGYVAGSDLIAVLRAIGA